MAVVYLADDIRHGRQVAMKVFRPELASVFGADRFVREVGIAARLNHPHIMPLYDSGEAGGFLYYVMPYIKGESLRHRIRRDKQLPIDEAVRIIREAAAGLAHAHAQHVIHRDIKPENILLHEGEAMVADFGIALTAGGTGGERLTETGLLLGTPEYMSPEQVTGESDLDARSDVYSLASVLYEMLAGEPPYTGPTPRSIMAKRMIDPIPGVRRLRPAVPAHVEQALKTALATVPADRFASTTAFAEALDRPGPTLPRLPSVAVLPFLNLSTDPENEYFADGITEDVIAHLSKIRALEVISRTSVMQFKERRQGLREIGSQLGVATVVEGSVRRAGDRVRIVAQLIDTETDRHLWTESYDRRLTDIFEIQTDVALRIAAALEAELSPDETARLRKEPTSDVQAYQLYLRGRHWNMRFTPEGISKGIEYFNQAIERDPGYALAHTAVALAYTELALGEGVGRIRPDQAYALAKDAAAKALHLDEGLGEAHAALAFLKYVHDFDWAGAEQEFQRALELNPNSADTCDAYGRMLAALGRHDEAIAVLERAQQLDPVAHRQDVASAMLRAGRNEEALQASTRGVEFDPLDPRGHSTRGWALLRTAREAEGLAEMERAVSLAPGVTMYLAQLGQAYAMCGRTDEAREILRQLDEWSAQRYVAPYHMAYVHTGLGDLEAAIDCLERAYGERSGGVYGIKSSFLFQPLRGHPRFDALLRKMNLTPD